MPSVRADYDRSSIGRIHPDFTISVVLQLSGQPGQDPPPACLFHSPRHVTAWHPELLQTRPSDTAQGVACHQRSTHHRGEEPRLQRDPCAAHAAVGSPTPRYFQERRAARLMTRDGSKACIKWPVWWQAGRFESLQPSQSNWPALTSFESMASRHPSWSSTSRI